MEHNAFVQMIAISNANLGSYLMVKNVFTSKIHAQKELDGTERNVSLLIIAPQVFMDKTTIVNLFLKDVFLQQFGKTKNVL